MDAQKQSSGPDDEMWPDARCGAPETRFAPGPYRWDRRQGGVVDANGERVLLVGVSLPGGNHPKAEEAEANTDLFIAAPLMYRALDDALGLLVFLKNGNDVSGIIEGNIAQILRVRSIARGEEGGAS